MVYTPLTGNAQAASIAVIGANINDTATPTNPTPPTNEPFVGMTPPTTVVTAASAPGDPYIFATATTIAGGMAHEGKPYTGYDSVIKATRNTMIPYNNTGINNLHPSSVYYTGATVLGEDDGSVSLHPAEGEDSISGAGYEPDQSSEPDEDEVLHQEKEEEARRQEEEDEEARRQEEEERRRQEDED